jgi:hypothetical protein
MARVRSGARNAPRFNGQFSEGYQFRNPQELVVTYGPWEGIIPNAIENNGLDTSLRIIPRNMLHQARYCILEQGVIRPRYRATAGPVSDTPRQLLGVHALGLLGGAYHAIFYRLVADDTLYVDIYSDTGVITLNTALTGVTTTVYATSWQNSIMFSNVALGAIFTYDVVNNVLNQIPFTVGADFIFVLDNNLCEVYKSGSNWEIRWSVDSLPQDFLNYGSGIAILETVDVRSVEIINNVCYIMGSVDGQIIRPTGSLPAFRFDIMTGFNGMPYSHKSTNDGNTLYFIGYQKRVVMYAGGQERLLTSGEDLLTETSLLYYSRRINKLVVAIRDYLLLLDTATGMWVSGPIPNGAAVAYAYLADSPRIPLTGAGDYLCAYYTITATSYNSGALNISVSTSTPIVAVGLDSFGGPARIFNIDVFLTKTVDQSSSMNVTYTDELDGERVIVVSPTPMDASSMRIRFWLDITARAISFTFTPLNPWSKDAGISHIEMRSRMLTNMLPVSA